MSIHADHMTAMAINDMHRHVVELWSWKLAKDFHREEGRRRAREHGLAANGAPDEQIIHDKVFLTWRQDAVTDSAA